MSLIASRRDTVCSGPGEFFRVEKLVGAGADVDVALIISNVELEGCWRLA